MNLAKQLLRNLQKGDDQLFAKYCEEKGFGQIFSYDGIYALILNDFDKNNIELLKLTFIDHIARYENTINHEEEEVTIVF